MSWSATRSQTVFMDLGGRVSVAASLKVAELFSQTTGAACFFVTSEEHLLTFQPIAHSTVYSASHSAAHIPSLVQMVNIDDVEHEIDYLKSSLVVDFTEPGKGLLKTALLFQESYNFHLQQDFSFAQSSFSEKIEYVEMISGVKNLARGLPDPLTTPVLTYSAEMAALLNFKNIPTIELCYRFKKPGSFLPQSLIIMGDTFGLLRKDEIQLIFEFYKNGKIEDLFVNHSVLEVDWDLLYFKMDRQNSSIKILKHPVSATEAFLDQFLKAFLGHSGRPAYSLEDVFVKAQNMDTIDLEATLEFMRKILQRCLLDLEKKKEVLNQPHWNWVRAYADCYTKTKRAELKKSLHQALLGVDLFLRVQERQKRVVGMH